MKPNDQAEAAEEHLALLLEAYDAALATGQPAASSATTETSAVLRAELEGLQACLRRLAQAWPRRSPVLPDPLLHPGPARLGRYHLIRLLGAGGFGLVYLAWDPHLRREVAVKVPRPEVLLTAGARTRFLREAQTAAGLDHPHLVPIYEVGEAGPAVYLVSAYCPGPTLEEWLQAHPAPVSIRAAAELLACLADTVHYIHARGVLHRDLKPANVLLQSVNSPQRHKEHKENTESSLCLCGEFTTPRITDFGLAKDLRRETQLTRSGAAVGTPAYMAPEQAEGRSADVGPATDVYALGVILYRLLTGRVPFLGANAVDTVRRIVAEEPLPPRRLRPEVPRDLQTVCLKCLHKEPGWRYASAGELAEDLGRFLRGEPVRARPLSAPQRAWAWARRRPAAATLVGVIATVLLGLQVGVWWHLHRLEQGNAELAGAVEREQRERERAEEQTRLARRHAYVNQIRFADQAVEGGQPWRAAEALSRLRPAPDEPDPRGLEWFELWRRCRREALYLVGHTNTVNAVVFTPDGRTLVSAGSDQTIKLWDTITGQERATPPIHPRGGWDLALAPDGRTLASAGWDDVIRLWDLATGQSLGPFGRHGPVAWRVAFSPDGRWLATWGDDQTLRLWDYAGRREQFRWAAEKCEGLAFSPDSRRLAAAGPGPVQVWDIASGRRDMALGGPTGRAIGVAFSPDGQLLACGRQDTTIQLWDLATTQLRQTLRGHTRPVRAVAFAPDGQWLTSGSEDKTVRLWDVATGREGRRLPAPGAVFRVAFAPDGRTLAVAGGPPFMVALHDLAPPAPKSSVPAGSVFKVGALAFALDGRTLATGSQPLRVPLWDPATGQVRSYLPPLWTGVHTLAYAPDGRTLAAGTDAGTVALFDLEAGTWRTALKGHGARVTAVAWAPDGHTLASASWDKTVRLWDVVTGRLRYTLEGHTDDVSALAFTPDGRTLASGSPDRAVRFWDPTTGQLQGILQDNAGLGAVAFAPGGALLATGNGEGLVKLWDQPSGRVQAVLAGHSRGVKAVAFSPDGHTLASAGMDQTIKLWDVATGLELLTLTGHTNEVNVVAFSPDGKVLASAGHDGTVKFWRAAEVLSPR